jgi:hypothetical protein
MNIRKKIAAAVLLGMMTYSCHNNTYQVPDVTNSGPNNNIPIKDKITPGFDSIKHSAAMIKDGDLVCRAGSDILSFSIANFSVKDKEYSHSGLAFHENGRVYVYHVYLGKENPTGFTMKEPLDSFCNPHHEKGYGVFRYDLKDDERTRLHEAMIAHYRNKMVFDKLFDLKTDKEQYCAEMIEKTLKAVTNNRCIIPVTSIRNKKIRDPSMQEVYVKQFDYIAVDNLYLNPFTTVIQRIKF